MKKILKYCFNTSVWTPTRDQWTQMLACVPGEEREAIHRFVFKSDCKQRLVGQLLVRHCLHALLGVSSAQLVIERNAKGRPFLASHHQLLQQQQQHVDFNVSHAGDYVIIAAGLCDNSAQIRCQLGVDVMRVGAQQQQQQQSNDGAFAAELARHQRLIGSVFSRAEAAYVNNRASGVESLTAFYRLWCMKESYVKARGDGVGFDLKRVECLPASELLIDLTASATATASSSSGKKQRHIVASDSRIFVDDKLVDGCRFYEQYFMNELPVIVFFFHLYFRETKKT